MIIALFTTFILIYLYVTIAYANPEAGTVVAGKADIHGDNNKLIIEQETDKAIINWKNFNIGVNGSTSFNQPSSSSLTLNRVLSDNPSSILGNLTANGNIIIVNPNGLMFGPDSVIDVGGLIASTADIRDDAFMNSGEMRFDIPGSKYGKIVNEGKINIHGPGNLGFVGPNIENKGTINAKLGKVFLASGETFTLDIYGDGLVELDVTEHLDKQSILNSGDIINDGGTIKLSSAKARNAIESVINVSGMLRAKSVTARNGKIILQGMNLSHEEPRNNKDILEISGTLDVSSLERESNIVGNIIAIASKTSIKGTARIIANGDRQAGEIFIGGAYKGGPSLPQSFETYIEQGSFISANAENGIAGKVIAWGEDKLVFAGSIEASGKGPGGQGGFVETSGGLIEITGSVAAAGTLNGGEWLLDPYDIDINTGATTGGYSATYTSASNSSVLNLTQVNNSLNLGTNVTVTTGAGGAEAGNIKLSGSLTTLASATLTLNAHRSIIFSGQPSIQATIGALNVILNADSAAAGNGAVSIVGTVGTNCKITTNGGSLTIGGRGTPSTNPATGNATYINGVDLTYAVLSSGNGNISIRGVGYAGTNNNHGVNISNSSITTSGSGQISITGTAGAGSNNINNGIYVSNSTISTFNSTLSLNGTGAGGGSSNFGIWLDGSSTKVSATNNGTVNLTGQGGTGGTLYSLGMYMTGSTVSTSNSGNINITTTGGVGSGDYSAGMWMDNATLNAVNGNITVTSNGAAASGINNNGLYMNNSSQINITGTGKASITAVGNGTGGSSANLGMHLLSSTITTSSGDIILSGTGNLANDSSGVYLQSANLSTTGGNITITGISNAATTGDYGVYLNGAALKTNTAGAVSLTGTGGTGTGTSSGIYVFNSSSIDSASTITLTGSGRGSGASNYGVQFGTTSALSTQAAGAININATSLAGTGIFSNTGTHSLGSTTTGNITLKSDTVNLSNMNIISHTTSGSIYLIPNTATSVNVATAGVSHIIATSVFSGMATAGLYIGDSNTTAVNLSSSYSFAVPTIFDTNGGNITVSAAQSTVAASTGSLAFLDPAVITANLDTSAATTGNQVVNFASSLTLPGTGATRTITTGAGDINIASGATLNTDILAFVGTTGKLNLGGNITSTNTALNINRATVLTSDSTINTGSALTTIGNTVTVNGNNFVVSGTSNSLNLGGNITATGAGTITLNRPTTLTANSTITSDTGLITVGGDVTSTTYNLAFVTNNKTNLGANITGTTGTINTGSLLNLTTNSTLSTTSGAITTAGPVTVNANNFAVSGTSNSLNLGGNITATGAGTITLNRPTTLTANSTITSDTGLITVGGDITSTIYNLAFVTNNKTNLGANITGTTGTINTGSLLNLTANSTLSTTSGAITTAGPVTVNANNFAVSGTSNSLNLGGNITATGAGTITLNRPTTLTANSTITSDTGLITVGGDITSTTYNLAFVTNNKTNLGANITGTTGTINTGSLLNLTANSTLSTTSGAITTAGPVTVNANNFAVSGTSNSLNLGGNITATGAGTITLNRPTTLTANSTITSDTGLITVGGDITSTTYNLAFVTNNKTNLGANITGTSGTINTGSLLNLTANSTLSTTSGLITLTAVALGTSNLIISGAGSTSYNGNITGTSGNLTISRDGVFATDISMNLGSGAFALNNILDIGIYGLNVSDSGSATISGGITGLGNVGGTKSVIFTARGNVTVNNSAYIKSTSDKLNITLNSNSDSNVGGGAISVVGTSGTNAKIESKGGSIIFGGAATPAASAAIGNIGNPYGVELSYAQILATGGNVSIRGKGYSNIATAGNRYGVYGYNSSVISTSGTGTLTIDGVAGDSTGGTQGGVNFNIVTITSQNGDINITGTGGGGNSATAAYLNNSTVQSAGTGKLNISGASAAGSSSNTGMVITYSNVYAQDGDIALSGTSASTDGLYISGTSVIKSSGVALIDLVGTIQNTAISNASAINLVSGAASPTIQSDTGKITLTGINNATGTGNYGVNSRGGKIVSVTSAPISITGTGGTGNSISYGVNLQDNSGTITDISSKNGDVTITGIGRGTGSTNHGIYMYNNTSIASTNNANIKLIGNTSTGTGIYIKALTNNIGSVTALKDVTLQADSSNLSSLNVVTAGDFYLIPLTNSATINLGSSGVSHIVDPLIFSGMMAANIYIGGASTGAITVSSAYSMASPTIFTTNGGAITVNAALTTEVGSDASFTFKNPATVNATIDTSAANGGTREIKFEDTLSLAGNLTTGGGEVIITKALTLTGTGNTRTISTLGGDISILAGASLAANTLAFAGSGDLNLGGAVTSTNTPFNISRPLILKSASSINTGSGLITAGDDITMTSFALTISGTTNNFNVNGDITSTTGVLTVNRPMVLTNNSNIDAGSNTASFNSISLGANDLTIDGSGNTNYNGNISGTGGDLTISRDGTLGVDISVGLANGSLTIDNILDMVTYGLNVSDSGAITVNKGITAQGNASGLKSAILSSRGDIKIDNQAYIKSTANKLHITLNSNNDGNAGGGAVSIVGTIGTNAVIESKGGNIIIGGGATPGTTPAIGNAINPNGVNTSYAKILAAGGNVFINGKGVGGVVATGQGVRMTDTQVTTSGTGTLTVSGQGGANPATNSNIGVYLSTVVFAVHDGNTNITGTGGNGSGSNHGMYLGDFTLGPTGTGAISITGTGNGGSGNHGIIMDFANIGATSNSITFLGTGEGDSSRGISLYNSSVITPAANNTLTMTGTSNNSTNNSAVAIELIGSAQINSGNGDVNITASNTGEGIGFFAASRISSSGTGKINITGTGGVGNSKNYGVYYAQDGFGTPQIKAVDGNVTIHGIGRGTGTTNYGIYMRDNASFEPSNNAALNLIAESVASSTGIMTSDNAGVLLGSGTNKGNITLQADRINLTDLFSITTTNNIYVKPYTNGGTLNIASAAVSHIIPAALISSTIVKSLELGDAFTGGVTVSSAYSMISPTIFRTGTGSITVNAALTTEVGSDASFTFKNPAVVNTDIDTSAANGGTRKIEFEDTLSLAGNLTTGGGEVIITKALTLTGTGNTRTISTLGGDISILAGATLAANTLAFAGSGDLNLGGAVTSTNTPFNISRPLVLKSASSINTGSGLITAGDDITMTSFALTISGTTNNFNVNGDITSTTGVLTVNRPMVLTNNSNIDAGSNTASFNSISLGANDLTIDGSGNTNYNGNISGTGGDLTISRDGTLGADISVGLANGSLTIDNILDMVTYGLNVSDSGAITVNKGITAQGNASGLKSAILSSRGDIKIDNQAYIKSTANKLHITLNSNNDGNAGGGAVSILGTIGTNAVIESKGGNIIIGGGATPGTTTAIGNAINPNGVYLSHAQILPGSGLLNIRGQGADDGGAARHGVYLANSKITAGNSIDINGISKDGTSNSHGIFIEDSVYTISNGNFGVTGTPGNGAGNKAIYIDPTTINATGTATITLSATGTGSDNGIDLDQATLTVVNGDLKVTGTSGPTGGHGVYIYNNSLLASTGVGKIIVDGTVQNGAGSNFKGIFIDKSTFTSSGGAISLLGTNNITDGGSAGFNSTGIYISNGIITATNNATIDIQGLSGYGKGAAVNSGVIITDNGGLVTNISTVNGNISILGQNRGDVLLSTTYGLQILNGTIISSSNNANITLTAFGASGNGGPDLLISGGAGTLGSVTDKGNIYFKADVIDLSNLTLNSLADWIITPYTGGAKMDIGNNKAMATHTIADSVVSGASVANIRVGDASTGAVTIVNAFNVPRPTIFTTNGALVQNNAALGVVNASKGSYSFASPAKIINPIDTSKATTGTRKIEFLDTLLLSADLTSGGGAVSVAKTTTIPAGFGAVTINTAVGDISFANLVLNDNTLNMVGTGNLNLGGAVTASDVAFNINRPLVLTANSTINNGNALLTISENINLNGFNLSILNALGGFNIEGSVNGSGNFTSVRTLTLTDGLTINNANGILDLVDIATGVNNLTIDGTGTFNLSGDISSTDSKVTLNRLVTLLTNVDINNGIGDLTLSGANIGNKVFGILGTGDLYLRGNFTSTNLPMSLNRDITLLGNTVIDVGNANIDLLKNLELDTYNLTLKNGGIFNVTGNISSVSGSLDVQKDTLLLTSPAINMGSGSLTLGKLDTGLNDLKITGTGSLNLKGDITSTGDLIELDIPTYVTAAMTFDIGKADLTFKKTLDNTNNIDFKTTGILTFKENSGYQQIIGNVTVYNASTIDIQKGFKALSFKVVGGDRLKIDRTVGLELNNNFEYDGTGDIDAKISSHTSVFNTTGYIKAIVKYKDTDIKGSNVNFQDVDPTNFRIVDTENTGNIIVLLPPPPPPLPSVIYNTGSNYVFPYIDPEEEVKPIRAVYVEAAKFTLGDINYRGLLVNLDAEFKTDIASKILIERYRALVLNPNLQSTEQFLGAHPQYNSYNFSVLATKRPPGS